MTLAVDLFFSFRSPYSYLALPKTLKLAADYDAGQDRIDMLIWRMQGKGLARRAGC